MYPPLVMIGYHQLLFVLFLYILYFPQWQGTTVDIFVCVSKENHTPSIAYSPRLLILVLFIVFELLWIIYQL